MEAMYNNKEWRKDFVERYLNAETTQEEERAFAQFCQQADSDSLTEEERQVGMLLQYAPEASAESLDMNAVAEFDRLFPKKEKKHRWLPAMGAVAAVLVAVVAVWTFLTERPAASYSGKGNDILAFTAICESLMDVFPEASSVNIERSGDSLLIIVRHDYGDDLVFSMDKESLQNGGGFKLKAVARK